MSDRSPIGDGNGDLLGCRALLIAAGLSVLLLLVCGGIAAMAVQAVR